MCIVGIDEDASGQKNRAASRRQSFGNRHTHFPRGEGTRHPRARDLRGARPAFAASVRDSGLDSNAIRRVNAYWESVRAQYAAFESGQVSGAAKVYLHEMPGGQFTNLKEQARSLGLSSRWSDVAEAYRAANDLFGDIIKVTPSSKVVGDMALIMVAQGLSAKDVADPNRDVNFPASVREMLRGDLGQPPGGWPDDLMKKVLKGEKPISIRPGALLPDTNLEDARREAETLCGRAIDDREFVSYLMYPKVFADYCAIAAKYGPVSMLPTPVFSYGMTPESEIVVELERGKILIIQLTAVGEVRADGQVAVFFELNGQPRIVNVPNRAVAPSTQTRRAAEDGNDDHVPASMPGTIASIAVEAGQNVNSGDILVTIEAMKMETTIVAPRGGQIEEILVGVGDQVSAKDLVIVLCAGLAVRFIGCNMAASFVGSASDRASIRSASNSGGKRSLARSFT